MTSVRIWLTEFEKSRQLLLKQTHQPEVTAVADVEGTVEEAPAPTAPEVTAVPGNGEVVVEDDADDSDA